MRQRGSEGIVRKVDRKLPCPQKDSEVQGGKAYVAIELRAWEPG